MGFQQLQHTESKVAPFAGAWIEIGELYADEEVGITVAPSRERGLKSLISLMPDVMLESLPSRERGLK